MASIDFSNTNTIWASILAETLYCLGLETAILCPGSRSAPLTVAIARHSSIEAIPILDERSAAFFALGVARCTGKATAVVCTSGTAGANFYSAVIEARESRVPLLVLTSDRPPELRECNAGQTIDQQKLFGGFPNWYSELAVPGLDLTLWQYLRQTLIQAWERTLYPVPGVVHLNLPFRDPLAPVVRADAAAWSEKFPQDFFDWIPRNVSQNIGQHLATSDRPAPIPYPPSGRTILVAGVAQPADPPAYCEAIAQLSTALQIPVLAEGLSPLRNYADLNPYLISTYDWMVREPELAQKLAPELVIRVGEMPTSKTLRQWLEQVQPLQWVVDEGDRNLDPLHGKTIHWRRSLQSFAANLPAQPAANKDYLKAWCEAETQMRRSLDHSLSQAEPPAEKHEGKAAWLLSQHLPPGTPFIVANSTAVRHVEWFWKPGNRAIRPFCNRGANGIDGTLSTALGVAHRQQSSVLLTGDLALLHDTNGFLIRNYFVGHLTIVLINNKGGGIFEHLPIAQFNPPFEEFFATPQHIDFALLCQTYNAKHELIQSWDQLVQRLNPLPTAGIRVLEIKCDRQFSAQWRPNL
ncbi:MAG: 2-succinyl-5-enolpyruvyl-6-hydroxy-3-cyclohexene-1-carboxylic-acid synthase [Leptolyngbyaceae cyanobacterium CSU_1_4]|nr:2-succinyl-5-enolpyruvyl-6-hydroxy-3-cyclohexene-1-carboxylic-acid synthase [Leptolyngbyaceae cyanobacterium CSU_1_4]